MPTLSQRLRGLLPIVPTPLNEDESLDEGGIERLAEFTLSYPFSGIFALASASEDENLPSPLIDRCTQLYVKTMGPKIPVLAKTCRPGTKATIERTKRMAGLGIDGAIVHFQHKMLGPDQVRRHFTAIADASPVPIVVYNNALRGIALTVEQMLELASHPNIVAIKAGGSNMAELQHLCLFARPDFTVMTAGGGQIFAGLALGATGHTAAPLLIAPERAFALYRHLQAGNLEAARAEQRIITEFLVRMPKLGNREVSAEVKAVLHLRGVIQPYVSAPFLTATAGQQDEISRLAKELDLFPTG
jgi:4-hydroxy-tetrahydrodipicolinate synthase